MMDGEGETTYPLGVGVSAEGEVSEHLLVGELVTLGDLDDAVEDEHVAVGLRLEHQNVL
jgi:hypothetical protein